MGRVECAGPQAPRWSTGHVWVVGEDLDGLGRSASLHLNPVGGVKRPWKLISSLEMACGQGVSSKEGLLLRWLIYSLKNMY